MGISVRLRIDGARETLAAFRKLPKEASAALRDANQEISGDLAEKIRNAALGSSPQSAAVAPSIKARRDRVPSITAGGGRLATKQARRSRGQAKTTAGKLVFGANFGATYLHQFRRHSGAGEDDYWFFRTIEDNEQRIVREWTQAADRVLSQWGSGG
jgi:hypothetical protein